MEVVAKQKLPWFLKKGSEKTYTSEASTYLVLDFETDENDKGSALNLDNSLVLACWIIVRPGHRPVRKSKYGNEYEMYELLEDIEGVDFVVAQNAKFELQWLKRCGVELRDILVYDTLLGAWVLDGNIQKPRDLDSLGLRYGLKGKDDLVKKLIKAGWPVRSIPRKWLVRYCFRDVDLTHEVFLQQVKEVERLNLLHICYVRNLTCAVLADIEFEGMYLDKEAVLAEYEKVRLEHEITKRKLEELADGINLASSKQLAAFLYETLGFEELKEKGKVKKTPGGAPLTNTDTLLKLNCRTQEQTEFLGLYRRFNKLDSLLSKNLEFFKCVVLEKGGKFCAVFNQNITATHRLSSSGRPLLFKGLKKPKSVQFQNLPREYKRLFCAGADGWEVAECDAAQLEFRVGADLGHDEVARKEIIEWFDVHSATRDELLKAGHEELLAAPADNRRQLSKSRTFAPLYGGRGRGKAEQAYVEFFNKKYEGISKTQSGWAEVVLDRKVLVTPYGMRFYWPDARIDRWGNCNKRTEIYNYPVNIAA